MKLLVILGTFLAVTGSAASASGPVSIRGGVGADASQERIRDGDIIMIWIAGIFQGYSPASKLVHISGKEYELAPGIRMDFQRLRPNQAVIFEVSGESKAGREIISAIREK